MKKKTIIIGLGVSGRSCAELLLEHKKSVLGIDQRANELKNDAAIEAIERKGLQIAAENVEIPWKSIEQLIISPGIAITHPIVQEAIAHQIEVIGEIEAAFRYLQNPCIGVTGTNGKTTVVMLTEHILLSAGCRAKALGNIGTSLSSYALKPDAKEILVVELSSFQLETLSAKCLDAAILLNITPDHLDRYASMDEYAQAKCRIQHCLKQGAPLWISQHVQKEYGRFLKGAKLFDDVALDIAPISPMRYIQLGVPERQNVQAAYVLCRHFGVSDVQFWRGLETFRKPKHRIEFVGEWNGISFYDDSKATNIDSVMHAVSLFEGPIVLLAGGVHKGSSYRPWIEAFRGKVVKIVAFGQAAKIMEEELKSSIPVERRETLEEAVCSAVQNAKPHTAILLSPGCSSFDQFRNYEHRGNEYQRIIEEKVWIERKRS